VEGRSLCPRPEFTRYDPRIYSVRSAWQHAGHLASAGIGEQVGEATAGFDMNIVYHNRNRRPELEDRLSFATFHREELWRSHYGVLTVPSPPKLEADRRLELAK